MYSLSILGLLLIGYVYDYKMSTKEDSSLKDQALEIDDILNIKEKNDKMRNIIIWSIILVTVVGSLNYLFKKKTELGQDGGGSGGEGFSYEKFIYDQR